ncbi:MAG: hypothetical protein BGO78_09720 [Chloroflexi bacterium 44-23]|nr:MAG: hypothetical protein BGO78_09720 [Chloroflexi bacterium 44-23]
MKMFSITPMKTLFTYPFQDPKAGNKLLIGSLLIFANFIIPIIPAIIIVGYAARIARNVIDGDGELALPEWDNWGDFFVEGFKMSAVILIYSIPALLIFMVGTGSYFLSLFAMIAQTSGGNEPGIVIIFYFFGLLLMIASIALGILLLFLEGLVTPPALMHMIHKKRFAAAFAIIEWWRIFRDNLAGFLFVFIVAVGFTQILTVVVYLAYYTVILCIIVPFIASFFGFYTTLVTFPLFAQAYKEGLPENIEEKELLAED